MKGMLSIYNIYITCLPLNFNIERLTEAVSWLFVKNSLMDMQQWFSPAEMLSIFSLVGFIENFSQLFEWGQPQMFDAHAAHPGVNNSHR